MNTITRREEDLFDLARELGTPAERKAYLDRACAGDPVLRQRVEDLLAAEQDAEAFFAEGRSIVSETVAPLQLLARTPLNPDGSRGKNLGEEPIGAKIGRYKLLEKIGEGGCGVVYMAEQEEPVRRRVALKIIKLGMETKSVIARFEAERQALAMMDHPNIARVFDAGATDRGPPYFIMELVRGVQITKYCDQHRLDMRARLDLFIQICHAIQHAHQKGIIHGDIKPSNIMVALHDGRPVPKVIDFGISKATEARLIDRELFTAYAQLVGTPAYMSPEQAEMGGVDIDTRSDIYSLGVLLYELLTGKTPFDGRELIASGLDEMRKTLREREPLRPSARLAALPARELSEVAACRQVDASRLVPLVRGDLDWVAMKALEKDRARRYETANGLAMDLQRHLDNEPVIARPPSWSYRFMKLVRRNRVVFIAGGAVAAALVVGMSMSTYLFLKEREARERAVAAEQQQARLRHEAEVRERITQAALLVSQERFAEADGLLSSMTLVEPTMEGAAVFRSVGEWHALHNRWKQAADRFLSLVAVNQLEASDTATMDYLRCGPSLLELGDVAGYERFRSEAIARYAGAPCPFADRIVKISLLMPASPRTLESMQPLADATAQSLAAADAGGDAFTVAWRSLAVGLLEYRRGNYAEALKWSQRCVASTEVNAPRTATAQLIAGMAFFQLGRGVEARAELAAARETIESKLNGPNDRGSPIHGFWFDWTFAHILWREAKALVTDA
ncbi:MAG TPA: serine/threonine-protein kinase [Opitutus sp.]|nr:serine/threonine-protein kinase [Opitutus sp.]